MSDKPLHFFLERYQEAYLAEMKEFISCVRENKIPTVGGSGWKNLGGHGLCRAGVPPKSGNIL